MKIYKDYYDVMNNFDSVIEENYRDKYSTSDLYLRRLVDIFSGKRKTRLKIQQIIDYMGQEINFYSFLKNTDNFNIEMDKIKTKLEELSKPIEEQFSLKAKILNAIKL